MELAEEYDISHSRMEYVHKLILSLEPKGITSGSIEECLIAQLTYKQKKNEVLTQIINEDFDNLIHRRYQKLMSKYKITEHELLKYKGIIAKLDPKPGLRILDNDTDYIVPDVIIKKLENDYIVIVNDKFIPNINLSRKYRNILNKLKTDKEAVNYVRNKVNSAKFLVKSMYMRTRTLERVIYSIIKHQRNSFMKTPE